MPPNVSLCVLLIEVAEDSPLIPTLSYLGNNNINQVVSN